MRGRLTESGVQDTLSPWQRRCVTWVDMLSTMRTLRAALILLETCDVPRLAGLAYFLLTTMSSPRCLHSLDDHACGPCPVQGARRGCGPSCL